jgi:hypothetical protein
MEKYTFDHNGATFTVRRATMRDRIRRDYFLGRLASITDDDVTPYELMYFARAVSQTTIEGECGYEMPTPNLEDDELYGSFMDWCELDGELAEKWLAALRESVRPLGDEALAPGAEDAAKKATD